MLIKDFVDTLDFFVDNCDTEATWNVRIYSGDINRYLLCQLYVDRQSIKDASYTLIKQLMCGITYQTIGIMEIKCIQIDSTNDIIYLLV